MSTIAEAKLLIPELCRQFYDAGWVSGTGGGMSIRVNDRIVVAPSGVQKERMRPEDLFVLDRQGNAIELPEARPAPYKPPKLSECHPLFQKAYELRDAGAVMHSHSLSAVAASLLDTSSEFKVTELEMIKGISGHGYYSECIVPIIENTAQECELTEALEKAILAYPQTSAVLVRRHGVYVWGKNWIEAKTQAECYDYLFQAALRLRSLGLDASKPSQMPTALEHLPLANGHALKRRKVAPQQQPPKAVVLDIEGTVAPITFVKEVLFPFARQHLQQHLTSSFDTAETQRDLQLLRQQAAEDGQPLPAESQPAHEVIPAACTYALAQMSADRKSTALKALQGHIWQEGYRKGQLQCPLYADVLPALQAWSRRGTRAYIFSSGSRLAQRDLFAHTTQGDVREHLSGYFDTTAGAKAEAASYENIQLSLGVDGAAQVLFATDVLAEAQAAAAAGWQTVLVVRPGNVPLAQHAFRVVDSMQHLL